MCLILITEIVIMYFFITSPQVLVFKMIIISSPTTGDLQKNKKNEIELKKHENVEY